MVLRLKFALVALVCTLGVLSSVGAGADRSVDTVLSSEDVLAITSSSSKEELEDIAVAAEESGWTMDEAIKQIGWRDNFSYLAHKIRLTFVDDFAKAEMVDGDTAWIAFDEAPPEEVKGLLDVFLKTFPHVSVNVRPDAGYTAVELNEAVMAVHGKAMAHPEVEQAVTEFLTSENTILVTASTRELGPSLAEQDLRRELDLPEVSRIAKSVELRVKVEQGVVLSNDESWTYHRGGETLSTCTQGFGTKNASGVRGSSTAGHCDSNQTDDGRTLTAYGIYDGNWGDFKENRGPGTHSNGFYAGSSTSNENTLRYVSTVRWASVGNWLCTNGKNTDKECDYVRQTGVCATNNCNLFGMEEDEQIPGDSGAPVYNGTKAYGLHDGDYTSGGKSRSSRSEANYMNYGIGTYVATN